MHVLLVTGSIQCGGAERVLADMANYWTARGAIVTFATWSGRDVQDFYALDRGVRRAWLDVPLARDTPLHQVQASWRRVQKLRRLVRETGPDAILSFIHTSNVLAILASRGLAARVVVSERMQPAVDPTVSAPWRLLRRLLYRKSDAVVAQSREAAEWLERNCGSRAIVIPNALRSLAPPAVERETLILATGRLVRQKGFDLLLRAFAAIAVDFPAWRVAIAGDGKEREALLRLRDDLGLQNRVEFIGVRRDIEIQMSRASLIVQPSRYEGFPNAVLEGMGTGAAVISTDCPSGPADMIEDGVNGLLVPVEDVAALARAMSGLMGDAGRREALGREAVKVRDRYRQDRIMSQWEACLLPRMLEGAA